ncbi:class I SAM-dependent methyltransferase [Parapedobacter sp. ISTM3]|uniref:Methyltransferase domain-containing protein n=1 Tax=Parapedobacter luteus TaxID=623280 RepID=A0A1T5A5Z2_9SPHI|nr:MULTISPECIES: class I SAM-dependent methyltransferase [Parapedobacter]MBK1440219.1 class I SAM-dependent methyltransferase [Parapedobacter sp. ISTM3]SKB30401.1 Methyltransferase domain-containing protein [Parapedobacter luteus]
MRSDITPYLKAQATFKDDGKHYVFPISRMSYSLKANEYYFNHPEWAEEYLTYCHRSDAFKSRWREATGSWTNKVVIDVGCGPGNINATLQEKPKILIGVDVASGSLDLARNLGYTTVLADANNLPFKSAVADIVVLNATLHHCENMDAVLKEAARLVKPGGLLVTDHDPQRSAWNYKGAAKVLWLTRLVYYRLIGHSFHKSSEQQKWALACETHHKPGHGVTPYLFESVLEPLDFNVNIYPHNHHLGKEVFEGKTGPVELKYKLGNLLSGRNPSSPASALTLMCVARKNG